LARAGGEDPEFLITIWQCLLASLKGFSNGTNIISTVLPPPIVYVLLTWVSWAWCSFPKHPDCTGVWSPSLYSITT